MAIFWRGENASGAMHSTHYWRGKRSRGSSNTPISKRHGNICKTECHTHKSCRFNRSESCLMV